jgi:excisionase family DNA binding protein
MHNRKPDTLLTPGEVAAINRVDPKTVTRWAAQGKMPAIRTPGGHRRFYWAAVESVLAGRDPWAALEAHKLPTPPRPGTTTNPTPGPTGHPATITLNPTPTPTGTGIHPDTRYYLDR